MIKKKKVALVKFTPRTSAQIRFCILVPQIENYDEDHFQIPPGFHCIFLPYADDLKKPDLIIPENMAEANKNQIIHAKLLVNSLTQNLDCRNFENPDIQNFFSKLQAIALDEKEVQPIEDLIQPDEVNLF